MTRPEPVASKRAPSVRLPRPPRELLGPVRVERLLRYALEEWALLLLCQAALWLGPVWLYPLWVLLIAGRLHALGVILHDLCHTSARQRDWRRRVLNLLAGYPTATTVEAMRAHHLRHHRHSNLPGLDPYYAPLSGRPLRMLGRWLGLLAMPALWSLRALVGTAALVVPRLRDFYGRRFLLLCRPGSLEQDAETLACARAEPAQVAFQLVLAAVTWCWPQVLLHAYFIPLAVMAALNGHRLLAEHVYRPAEARSVASVLATSRDHGRSALHRLFLAPRNVGYHAMHHLHPQVALEHLPGLHAWYAPHLPRSVLAPRSADSHGDSRAA